MLGVADTHTFVLDVCVALTFVLVDTHSLMPGVAAAHTPVLVGDERHASVLKDTGVHTTVLEAVSVVVEFCESVTSFVAGLTI